MYLKFELTVLYSPSQIRLLCVSACKQYVSSTHVHAFEYRCSFLWEIAASQSQEIKVLCLSYYVIELPLDLIQHVRLEISFLDLSGDLCSFPSRQRCPCIWRWKYSIVRGYLKQSEE